uniref:Uncharacterized protein n=1 Tax=Pongo abelii TaxID=9601 RepID=A0A8I5T211_PONAB
MPAATVDHSQRICEVWACNLDEEMKKIRQVIRKYNYVAMDTDFLSYSISILLVEVVLIAKGSFRVFLEKGRLFANCKLGK